MTTYIIEKNKNRKQGRFFTESVSKANSKQGLENHSLSNKETADNSRSYLQQFLFVFNFVSVFAYDFIFVYKFVFAVVFAFASNSRAMETSSLWQQKLGAHICPRLYQQGEKNTFGKPVTRLPELWLHPGPSSIQPSWETEEVEMHACCDWEIFPIQCNHSLSHSSIQC